MTLRALICLVAFAALLPFSLHAQTGAAAGSGTAAGLSRLESARGAGTVPPGVQLSAEAALTSMGMSMVDGGGSVETWRGRVRGGITRRFGHWSAGLTAEEEWSAYDVDADPMPGWPGNLRIDRLSLNAGWRPGGDWTYFGSATISAGVAAGDNKWSDGISSGGAVFGRRQVTPKFAWLIGLIVYDRLGDSTLIVPVPGVDWQITPQFGLVTGHGIVLTYKPKVHGSWRINGSALFDSTICATESGDGEAIVRDERIPLTIGLEYRAKGGFRFQTYAGTIAWRRWQLQQEDGTETTWQGEPSAIFGVEGGTVF